MKRVDDKPLKDAGFKLPVFISQLVWDHIVATDKIIEMYGWGESNRLWDVLNALAWAIFNQADMQAVHGTEVRFAVLALLRGRGQSVKMHKVPLKAVFLSDEQGHRIEVKRP